MTKSDLSPHDRLLLMEAAQGAVKRAYAPYSNFRVGAAILTEQRSLFSGCNVENASYGLTVCAERAAIFSAVAQEGGDKMRILAVAVVNERGEPCPPCGACRQVIFEFGPDAVVIFQGPSGLEERCAADLLPEGFGLR